MSWSIAAFAVWPYVALTIFVVGHIWRWRADRFGLTTRTTEIVEKKWLLWASPIFHVGLLLVLLGHLLGLVIPRGATRAVAGWFGVSDPTEADHLYHLMAMSAGVVAGCILVVGVVLLVLRRFVMKTRFRLVTRPGDVVMYILLVIVVTLGMWTTFSQTVFGDFDYRATVSIWFRSVFYANPQFELMGAAPVIFQIHAIAAFGLFAVWPFSRLVHLWSAPVGYLTRPLIVYRPQAAAR